MLRCDFINLSSTLNKIVRNIKLVNMEDTKDDFDIEASQITKISLIMPNLPKFLTIDEKTYLLAIERGDISNVRRMLQKARRKQTFDVNCVDSLGRGAFTISIDQEHLEMVELLVVMGVQTKDALLHAINVEFVEAVELLLEHEELIHKDGELYSWQKVDINTAMFTSDITPLILAAHRNNYEILKILLDRGASLPMPHDVKCGCEECIKQSEEDSLRHSLSRLNEYKALASPSLIALSSSDPILTAFQLSWELRNLAFAEPECKAEYMELRRQCQQFAVDLLQQSRSSHELAIILNHDPESPPYEKGEHMKLARLELAIQFKQKKFVAHPNIQQLLASIWYEGVPGFRRKSAMQKVAITVKFAVLFPFYCMLYMVCPETRIGKLMRKPFMKFLIHASSYLFFLLLLILVSQRVEDPLLRFFGIIPMDENDPSKYDKQRGISPTFLEYIVLIYVVGFIYEELHEMYVEGMNTYLRNLWNFIDFSRNFLYIAVFFLRGVAYIQQTLQIEQNPSTAYIKREEWEAFDPQLIAEGLFAAANIFSALKLVHMFSINPHLGPLQISLGRMVIDIVKFFFIYSLVLFAFACGLNQLLWYFSDLERQKCYHLPNGDADFDTAGDACMKWRRFSNVFESSQSLFWASFGLVDLSSFELTGIKTYTRFWGLLMFGSYSVINVIVLLNLLIAMMSNSYATIDQHSDTEWKFARTKLWLNYFEESATLPSPFNIIPNPKHLFKLFGLRKKDKLRRMSSKRRNREEKERDYRYTAVMRALVWRYVSSMHRKCEESPVTEDDINELKSDMSSFRYELLEVLQKNGMDISGAEKKEKAILGKRMKIWERRLMKDFKVAPVTTDEETDLIYTLPPENEHPRARFKRIARLVVADSTLNKWRQVVKGAQLASQIGYCHTRDSFKKQQNLQKAIEAAKKLAVKSPDSSRSTTPSHYLPDMTGSSILDVIREFSPNVSPRPVQRSMFTTDNGPTIYIDPPEKFDKRANDLINLESAKNSPKLATNKQVSSEDSIKSSESNFNNNDLPDSLEENNLGDQDKFILNDSSSATAEPSTSSNNNEQILDSVDNKSSLCLKSSMPDSNKAILKINDNSPPIASKSVTFSMDNEIETIDLSDSIPDNTIVTQNKKNDAKLKEPKDKQQKVEVKLESLPDPIIDQNNETVHKSLKLALVVETLEGILKMTQQQEEKQIEAAQELEVIETDSETVLEHLEPAVIVDEEVKQLDNINNQEVSSTFEDREITEEARAYLGIDSSKDNVAKSPLAKRNIHRIGDKTRKQLRTGWL